MSGWDVEAIGTAGQQIGAVFNVLLHRAFPGELTVKWREAHMKELLQEMKQQAKALGREGCQENMAREDH